MEKNIVLFILIENDNNSCRCFFPTLNYYRPQVIE